MAAVWSPAVQKRSLELARADPRTNDPEPRESLAVEVDPASGNGGRGVSVRILHPESANWRVDRNDANVEKVVLCQVCTKHRLEREGEDLAPVGMGDQGDLICRSKLASSADHCPAESATTGMPVLGPKYEAIEVSRPVSRVLLFGILVLFESRVPEMRKPRIERGPEAVPIVVARRVAVPSASDGDIEFRGHMEGSPFSYERAGEARGCGLERDLVWPRLGTAPIGPGSGGGRHRRGSDKAAFCHPCAAIP